MKSNQLLILGLMFLSGVFNLAQAQQAGQPQPGTNEYQAAKLAGQLDQFQIVSIPANGVQNPESPLSKYVAGNRDTDCYIPHDTATYSFIPRNDDGSSAQIQLPFTFNMYGTEYTSVYVNNNGNITFDSPLSGYTASGFPISTPMVAPFWGDVDTRGSGSDKVWYKVTSNALYVNYPNVGYFPSAYDKVNTFQVIITDGTDPTIGIGNNVAFYYADMSWTTGSASGGTNGFGGVSATVGVNSGDGTNFFQIGRFNQSGNNFNGAYDLDGGVDWLDGQCFVFNVNSESTSNIPPLLLNLSSSSLTICEGDSSTINFTFTGPEAAQEVTVSLNGGNSSSAISSTTVNGESTSGVISIFGATAGAYQLQLTATDNGEPVESTTVTIQLIVEACGELDCPNLVANIGDACNDGDDMTENDTVTANCECVGTPVQFDCPDLEANFGDACELAEGMGIINPNCECVPAPSCENFTYYLADHAAADGISTIYGVTLSGGVATMDSIATSDIEVHIAFNAGDNMIYAVSKHTNSYRVLDPIFGTWGPTVPLGLLGADYGEITAAVFAPNGKLLFGSQNQNAIFSVNIGSNVVSSYDTYSPVTGGDLAFTSDGMLYMATRSGNGLYEVYPAPVSDVLLANVPVKVTGLAATDSDQLLLSAQGMMSLELYNLDGSNASSYALQLNGAPYTLRDGDLASGCNTRDTVATCDNYATFYVNHGPDVVGSDLYTVDFIGGNAELNLITNVDFEAHIGYNSEDELMYFVNKNGSLIRIYNVGTGLFEGDLPILGGVDQLTAVAYNAADGQLYVGDANSDVIASIDLNTGIASYYANAPVFGGDLTFLDGTMYLARRSLSELYEIVPFGNAILLGSIPDGVNGMAPSPNGGNLVTSSAAQNAFVEISAADGSTISSFPAMLGGNPFTFINGDMASGCIDGLELPTPPSNPFQSGLQSELTAYPNPTSGQSQVVFTTAETGRTLVEVYDMSGRNIATLFNQEAQQGKEYRIDFNGAALPNGVYIYRMTTQNETIIEKFMIAR